jgi:hypothetical protein
MKISPIPLRMTDFTVENIIFNYMIDESIEETEDLFDDFEEHPVEADFDILFVEEDYSLLEFRLEVWSNFDDEEAKPGYSYYINATAEFEIEDPKKKNDEQKAMLTTNALGMLINQVRSYIATISAFHPEGSYFLPPFDISNLMDSKMKMMMKEFPELKIVEGKKKKTK